MQETVLTAKRVSRHIGLMDVPYENRQRIERLTSLETVLRHIERSFSPIGCSTAPLDYLLGATLAAGVPGGPGRPDRRFHGAGRMDPRGEPLDSSSAAESCLYQCRPNTSGRI